MTNKITTLPDPLTYEELLKRVAELEKKLSKQDPVDKVLLESEDKYHFLFDNLQETVIIYKVLRNENGIIVDWIIDDCNILAKKNLGRPFEEAKGKPITELFGKEMVQEYIEVSRNVDKLRNVETFETYFDFNKRYYSSKVFFITKDLYVNVSEDITERVYAEKESEKLRNQLAQAHKMEAIGTLAGGIAHDFNNILSSIIGFTELALDDVKQNTEIEDNLQEVYAAGKRAKDLVKQILAFARQSKEESSPIKINNIIEEQLKFLRSSLPSTIVIRQNTNSDSLIMGNPTQIHQLIMNLCTNAAHSMENRVGELVLNMEDFLIDTDERAENLNLEPGKYIEIKISDTGTGIPAGVIDSIFEPYFTTKAPGEGTGMGLAMVKGIVEGYGGRITVNSSIGEGTTFNVYLPATERPDIKESYELELLPTGTERILFVDDELSIVKMGQRVLSKLGYSVTPMTDSVAALKLFRSMPGNFDLVISDMTMPNMTGQMLATEILNIRPDTPVIICTGYSKKFSECDAMKNGIEALIYKPVVKSDLARTVRKVIDARSGNGAADN